MSPWRKEKELGKKMELPLGRGIGERTHSGPLAVRWQKEIGRKKKKKGSPEIGPPWEPRDRLPIWEGLPTGNWVCSSCLYN